MQNADHSAGIAVNGSTTADDATPLTTYGSENSAAHEIEPQSVGEEERNPSMTSTSSFGEGPLSHPPAANNVETLGRLVQLASASVLRECLQAVTSQDPSLQDDLLAFLLHSSDIN